MPNSVAVQPLAPAPPLPASISPSIATPGEVANGKPKKLPANDPVVNAVGGNECPKWIADKIGLPVEEVAHLEVTCSAKIPYDALLEYLALTSVDATRNPPAKIDPSVDNPESPGRLSTLWSGPGKGVFEAPDPDEPDKAEYRLGLGYARALANGQDVFAVHVARGNPIEVYYKARMYRALLLFAANPTILKTLAEEALLWKNQNDKKKRLAKPGKYVLYTLSVDDCGDVQWRNHGQKDARPLSSIFLKKGQQDSIVADFKSFKKSTTKKWYLEHGLPYRRSYLFYGPPGVGKTSLIRGLAGELKLTTCFMCLADKKMGNAQLQDALRSIPKPSMIVLEDVDVLFNEDRKSQTEAPLTFSGLLNALDGLISADGILTVMTTNHIERLDPALVRAGRVDRRFEFTAPDREQVASLFQSYYPDAKQGMSKKFSEMVFSREEKSARSIATLQQHFVYTRENTAEESLEMLPEFFKEFYPDNLRDSSKNLYV